MGEIDDLNERIREYKKVLADKARYSARLEKEKEDTTHLKIELEKAQSLRAVLEDRVTKRVQEKEDLLAQTEALEKQG